MILSVTFSKPVNNIKEILGKEYQKIKIKIEDNDYHVRYERKNKHYTHVLEIAHKANSKPIIQSYDDDLFDAKGIGNTCVGLTYYETKLTLKKKKPFLNYT